MNGGEGMSKFRFFTYRDCMCVIKNEKESGLMIGYIGFPAAMNVELEERKVTIIKGGLDSALSNGPVKVLFRPKKGELKGLEIDNYYMYRYMFMFADKRKNDDVIEDLLKKTVDNALD